MTGDVILPGVSQKAVTLGSNTALGICAGTTDNWPGWVQRDPLANVLQGLGWRCLDPPSRFLYLQNGKPPSCGLLGSFTGENTCNTL